MTRVGGDVKGRLAVDRQQAMQAFNQAVAGANPVDIDKAATALEHIVTSDRKDFESLFHLGVLRVLQGRHDDALRRFKPVARALPREPVVRLNLAAVAHVLGRHAEAIDWCDECLALTPDSAKASLVKAWTIRGAALRALRRDVEAAAGFERALAIDPRFPEASRNYGSVLRDLRRFAESLAALDRALALEPHNAQALCDRAAVLLELDRPAEALDATDKALALAPDEIPIINSRALALKLLGRTDEALLCCEAALAVDPAQAMPWLTRASVLTELGQVEDALASYDKGLRLAPRDVSGLSNKSLLLGEIGRFDEAVATLRAAIALDPRRASLFYNLTQIETLALDDPAVAAMQAQMHEIGARTPQDQVFLHYALAKVLEDNGDPETGFAHVLAGSATKRRLIRYDEKATLDELARTEQVFDADLLARLRGDGEDSPSPIFIVGMPRSGSSLIEQILASHPGIVGLGETDAFNKVLREFEPGKPGDFAKLVESLSREHVARIGAAAMQQLRRLAPEGRIVDKSLDNFRFLGLIHAALPKARLIHIRRDAVETCLSSFTRWFVGGFAFSYDLGELGRYHRAYERLMDHWSRVLPAEALLTLDYEAVVADLEGQSRRLAAFCGLEWDARCLDFHKTERQVRTASKKQVRQPLFDGRARRRAALAPHLRPLLEALAGRD